MKIEKINNGYIISWEEPYADNDELHIIKQVIEVKDDSEMADKDTLTELFYFIAEHFGIHYDKWKKDNLNIKWNRKGTKYE